MFYTETFIQPALVVDGIRLATIEEIIAMKVDVVQRIGRKKDFWDLHELLTNHDIQTMIYAPIFWPLYIEEIRAISFSDFISE